MINAEAIKSGKINGDERFLAMLLERRRQMDEGCASNPYLMVRPEYGDAIARVICTTRAKLAARSAPRSARP